MESASPPRAPLYVPIHGLSRFVRRRIENDDSPDSRPLHASRHGLVEEADAFVEQIFAAEVFSEDVLDRIRALDQPEESGLLGFCVMVDALYTHAPEPFACIVTYRIFAGDSEQAAALAMKFERRCGADAIRVDNVEQLATCDQPRHAGVWWRSGRAAYPPEQFAEE